MTHTILMRAFLLSFLALCGLMVLGMVNVLGSDRIPPAFWKGLVIGAAFVFVWSIIGLIFTEKL